MVKGNLTIRSKTVPFESVLKRGRELPTGSFFPPKRNRFTVNHDALSEETF